MSFMIVKNQTYANSEDFSGRNNKRYNVLFECFDHSVNDKMSTTDKNAESYQVKSKQLMGCSKFYCCQTIT